LYRKSATVKKGITDYILLVLGFITVLLMSAEPSATTAMATSQGILSMIFLFIAGIIIAIALILPGISGSFMLLALGLYDITLNAINNVNLPFLIPLVLGIAVGTIGTTKLIEKLLQKYPGKTYMLIIGFVIGSLVPVFPGIPSGSQLILSAVAFIIGFIFIFWLGRKGLTD
jgi:putative membrane protein